MLKYLDKIRNVFTMPTAANEDFGGEDRGFAWSQSARTVLAILFVALSAFVLFWIMS
jgi:hypothetical protein